MRDHDLIILCGALAAAVLAPACVHTGNYVWVDQYRTAAPAASEYQIGPGDVLTVRVLGHDELSSRVRVRSDGRISLPMLKDFDVNGQTPDGVSEKLTAAWTDVVKNPVVTVTVDEARPLLVSITGEVTRPGVYPIESPAGVLQAIASAGGLSQFAHEDQIYVLRRIADSMPPVRIRFTYRALAHAEGQSGTFSLQRNDLVVVE